MGNMGVGLQEELIADLTTELKNDEAFDLEILTAKVVGAIREVKLMRNYGATSYTDKQIQEILAPSISSSFIFSGNACLDVPATRI